MTPTKFTPGPWEVKSRISCSHEIFAKVNIGLDMDKGILQPIYNVPARPSLQVGDDGKVWATISYDSCRQFPSNDFIAMQKANADLIAASPEMFVALLAAKKCIDEAWSMWGTATTSSQDLFRHDFMEKFKTAMSKAVKENK